MKRLLHLILSCSLCILFTACAKPKETDDLGKFIEEVKKTPAQPIEPLPGVKIVNKFSYSSVNKRDPFTQVVKRSQNGTRPDQHRAKEPLEAYNLDSLKMVGTFLEDGKTWGIVLAPDQTIYKVKAGDHLGQHFGKITAVKLAEIEILETVPQGESWQQRETSLVLD